MKRRRGYFKHYNDASRGETLSVLAVKKEYLAIAIFWHSLEVANMVDDGGKGSVDIDVLCALYNAKKKTVVASYQAISDLSPSFKFVLNGIKIDFVFANYAEYQETRGQKRRKNDAKNDAIKDKRLKIKDKRYLNTSREVETSAPKPKPKPIKKPPKSAAVWSAYASAYEKRYGLLPIRNQSVNAMLCKLVDYVGDAKASELVAWYVWQNGFYEKNSHPVNLLLRDAQKLITAMETGRPLENGPKSFAEKKSENFKRLWDEAEREDK